MNAEILPLPSFIFASARQAGRNSMLSAGRSKWSRKDMDAAGALQDEMIERAFGSGPVGSVRYNIAIGLEANGILHIAMTKKDFFRAIDEAHEAMLQPVEFDQLELI